MSDARILAALRPVVAVFAQLGISYQIGGSIASSMFGKARSTLDIDLAADVRMEHAEPIAAALRGTYYAEPELIREAVRHRSCFNLIYLPDYFKVDVFVPKDTAFAQAAFARHVLAEIRQGHDAGTFRFSTPEDVALHKLAWHVQAGGSERQWQDLCGLLRAQTGRLDVDYLRKWATHLGMADLLEKALRQAADGS
jgi:hypothetical protein